MQLRKRCNLLSPLYRPLAHGKVMPRRPISMYIYAVLALVLLLLFARNDAPSSTFSRYLAHVRPSPPTPYCPVPWLNQTALRPTEEKLDCANVQTNHTEWKVELCYDTQACNRGYVQVDYLNTDRCTTVEKEMNPSRMKEQNDYVKRKLGPHTISVLFDGATRDGGEKMEYLGECSYRKRFDLRNGGRFALRVVLVYEVRQVVSSLFSPR